MKRTTFLTIALIIAMPSLALAGDPVYFADPNLKATVETELGVTDPNASDMLGLTSLTAYNLGIVDPNGIQYATNLNFLNLNLNSISDISAISALSNLTELYLNQNGISDISALEDLNSLTKLSFYRNSISDISSLSGLTNLRDLYLHQNNISDINALSGLNNLELLNLNENYNINDISALSGLTNLLSLSLGYNDINDLSPLSGLTNLSFLYLHYNNISNITGLAGLNIRSLRLGRNNINDLSPLSGLTTNLISLYLSYNNISDISALSGLTNLETIDLKHNNISNITALSNLFNLSRLELQSNNISDISPLYGLSSLVSMNLSDNNISDIPALSSLSILRILYLHYNNISDISALSNLTELTRLWLTGNTLNQSAYCMYLPLIENNNPGIELTYEPGECTLNSFNTRLEGTWYLRSLSTQKNGQPDNFGYDTGVVDFQNNGYLSGILTAHEGDIFSVSGMSMFAEDGSVYMLLNNPDIVVNLAVNVSRDVMASNDEDPNTVYFNVYVRKDNSYTLSNLVGTWYWRSLGTQKNGEPNAFGYDTGTFDFNEPNIFTGTMTDQDGNSWSESGTFSVDSNGIVSMDFNDGNSMDWALNAGKNVMVSNSQEPDWLVLDIMVKKGNSYSSSDIVGTWYSRSIGTQMNGQPDNFGYDTLEITIQDDGSFILIETATTSGENGGQLTYSTGTASIDPNGIVTLYVPSESFELNPVLNAGKNVMINNYMDPGDEIGLEIFLKKESLPGDLNFDGIVNFRDFAIFAQHWLESVD